MPKLVALLVAGALIVGFSLTLLPGSATIQVERVPVASSDQNNGTAVKLRTAFKEEAPQTSPSPAQRDASFLVFLSFLYGKK